jgi:hypothetical protein
LDTGRLVDGVKCEKEKEKEEGSTTRKKGQQVSAVIR